MPKAELKTETVRRGKQEYVILTNAKGEIFHFKKTRMRRGMPFAPFPNLESLSRPMGLLTLRNLSDMTAVPVETLGWNIRHGSLPGVYRVWKYGCIKRHGWLVEEKAAKEWMARRALSKYMRRDIDWDRPALEVLGYERESA